MWPFGTQPTDRYTLGQPTAILGVLYCILLHIPLQTFTVEYTTAPHIQETSFTVERLEALSHSFTVTVFPGRVTLSDREMSLPGSQVVLPGPVK